VLQEGAVICAICSSEFTVGSRPARSATGRAVKRIWLSEIRWTPGYPVEGKPGTVSIHAGHGRVGQKELIRERMICEGVIKPEDCGIFGVPRHPVIDREHARYTAVLSSQIPQRSPEKPVPSPRAFNLSRTAHFVFVLDMSVDRRLKLI
jgi:hypothetical protein